MPVGALSGKPQALFDTSTICFVSFVEMRQQDATTYTVCQDPF
jgi:hypothetical protein